MAPTRRRKHRTHVRTEDDPAKKGPPKSFVFWRGKYGLLLKALETDLRRVLEPLTARNLRESKQNQLKDFVLISGPLGVAHFLILTATEHSCYLRVAKTPKGPTLTMRIHSYSLMKDVVASQQRPRLPESLWKTSPLVMSNFPGSDHLKLATVLFQNLFPAINVRSANLATCKRVLLLNYDKESNRISFRHYSITVQPSGVTTSIKELVSKRNIPDLGSYQDVAEFLTKSGYASESEGEEAGRSRVTLTQDLGRGNIAARQSRIRLQEIGPRMELEIVKVEEGICSGKVLYHQHIKKSPEEIAEQNTHIKSRDELRQQRRRQQEENVRKKVEKQKRKAEADAEQRGAKAAKKRKKQWWEEEVSAMRTERDDDLEYYRQEVGEEPDELIGRDLKKRKTEKGGSRKSNSEKKLKPKVGTKTKPSRSQPARKAK